jgi:succinate dehydrogenase/fumarate reductase flavoprotein subunit
VFRRSGGGRRAKIDGGYGDVERIAPRACAATAQCRRPPRATRKPASRSITPTPHPRTPGLLSCDEVARAINSEVKAGRGTPHGGVYLGILSAILVEEIKHRMALYHQFMELSEVDITKDEMEVGPTLGCATSPTAARRSAPSTSRSPTTC